MKPTIAILLAGVLALPAFGQVREYNGELSRPRAAATDQLIVKWRAGAAAEQRVARLKSTGGVGLQRKTRLTSDTDVLKLDRALAGAELDSVIASIAADPQVEYAVADEWRALHALPTDPLYAEQWYFGSAQASATRAQDAWDTTVGNSATIVAVLDTGARYNHPDLSAKLLPGHDFVSNPTFSTDGDGRDADADDPGDFVTTAEAQTPPFTAIPCTADSSSWHGTRVASLIAAQTNNEGIAGTGWNTRILPVRVMAKCGGIDSDIIAGMRWAAGIAVPGVPANPTPAKILNLSLGGTGLCSAAYQQAITEITAQGVVVVISVGNEGRAVSSPANCNGVIAVAGLRHAGTKVGFSNLGPNVTIGAPGGNCVNPQGQPCLFSLVAATDAGTTTPTAPAYTDQLNFNVGTSFAAPLVAGAAALMHAVNGQISPSQYRALLRETAATFPTSSPTTTAVCQPPSAVAQGEECICTTQTCGAGMLNTHAAVLAAGTRPFADAQGPATINTGTDISIDGSRSVASNGRTIVSHQWSAVNVTGATPAFGNPSQAVTTYQVSGDSQFTLRLTVTDDQGTQDTGDIAVSTAAAPPPPPPPPPPPTTPVNPPTPGGGGGGGSIGFLLLGLLTLAAFRRERAIACRLRVSAPGRRGIG
jgi:serine protease